MCCTHRAIRGGEREGGGRESHHHAGEVLRPCLGAEGGGERGEGGRGVSHHHAGEVFRPRLKRRVVLCHLPLDVSRQPIEVDVRRRRHRSAPYARPPPVDEHVGVARTVFALQRPRRLHAVAEEVWTAAGNTRRLEHDYRYRRFTRKRLNVSQA